LAIDANTCSLEGEKGKKRWRRVEEKRVIEDRKKGLGDFDSLSNKFKGF
jgi:hypothetical protein